MKLTLDKIQAKDLQDTSTFMDVQDPIIQINIGKVFLTTERVTNQRKDATFTSVLTADITEENYKAGVTFDVDVLNENTFGTQKHVGRGSVSLKMLIPDFNQHVSFIVPLIHYEKDGKSKTGVQKGQVIIRGYLEGPAAPPASAAPPAKAPAAEKAPEKVAEKAPEKSSAAVEKPAPEKATPAAEKVPEKATPAAEKVPEKAAPAAEKVAEKAATAAEKVLEKAPEKAAPAPAPATPVIAKVPAGAAAGVEYDESQPLKLRLDEIKVRNLKDKGGSWDKQDPALRITVGEFKHFDTERIKDAGTDADFPETYELDIPVAKFTNNLAIELEAFNVGGMPLYTRTHLGKMRVPLNSLIGSYNQHVPITVDLMYHSSKGEAKQGQVLMRGIIEKALKTAPVVAAVNAKPAAEPQPAKVQAAAAEKKADAPVAAAEASKPTAAAAPASTVTHFLFISSIVAKGLRNVELTPGDKNDPYVVLGFGSNKWSFKTEVRPEAGSEASWQYERAGPQAQELRFAVTDEELRAGALTVVVNDKNSYFGDKLIGKGEAKMPNALMPDKAIAASQAVMGEFTVTLADKSGSVTFTVERETVVPGSPAPTAAKPAALPAPVAVEAPKGPVANFADFKHSLFISKISGKGLKNVEKMWMDKNDPYMVLKFGENTWTYTTSVQDGVGADAVWEYNVRQDPQMKFSVALEELRDPALGLLKVTAMDKNKSLSDALIGEGEISVSSVPSLCPAAAKEEKVQTEITVELTGGAGSVVFTVERETVSKTKKSPTAEELDKQKEGVGKPASATKPFEVGQLLVTRIVCQDLINVEGWGGKNDPFVVLQLGAEERQTEVIQEGGANVCYDFLNFSFDVDRRLLEFEPLNVTVTDKNSLNSNKLIGTTSSSVRYMLQKVDEGPIQLPLSLKNDGKDAGTVILFLTLKPAELVSATDAPPLDPSFQSGLLHINRIRAFELQKPKGMISSGHVANPYVKLSFGTWQYKTQPLSVAAAGSPIFDNLDLSTDITVAMLQSVKLSAEVFDKGMVSDTLVGKGECSMRSTAVKVGEEMQISVDLVNNGATAGKLLIFASAAQKKKKLNKSEIVVDAAFEQGYCSIKAITAHNLKNTEIGPFGKQDPFIVLEFAASGWKEQTAFIDDAGSDAHWKDLDLRVPTITRAQLLEQDLLVTAMDENSTRSDALIGRAKVSLVEAAAKGALGTDVDIEADLLDDKGAPAGRLVLCCSLHAMAAQLSLSAGLKEGVVKIRKIIARGLVTGNMFSKSKPSIHVQYGAWEDSTPTGEGADAVWDYLKIQSAPAASAELLIKQPLVVTLLENDKKIASGVIENMLLPGSQAEKDVDVPVTLMHLKNGTPCGKLMITLNVGAPDEDIAVLAAKEEDLPMPAYSEAVLLIKSIKAEGLAEVDMIGKSDPFVALTLSSWSDQTGVCDNAGGAVIWNDLKFREEFSADVLVHQPLDVTVYDKNTYRKNILLGSGQVSLKRAAYSVGKEVELVVQLKDKSKSKGAGKVIILAEIREQSKELAKVLPADFKSGMLHVFRVSGFNLPNRELTGKQDPYAVIKLGDFKDRTPTMNEAGSDPVFDLLDIKTVVTASILENQKMEVELWEDNTSGHILLGSGFAVLKKVTTMGEEVELRVNLKDSRGEAAGRALVFARLEEMPLSKEKEAAIPIAEGFTRGTACIRKICTFGLANTELFAGLTKQDPYVVVRLGSWSGQTKVKDNAGTNSIWDSLDLEVDVDRETLQTAVFDVVVMNKNNLRAHSEIGSGTVAIKRAGVQVNNIVELSVDLVHSKTSKASGRAVLHVEVVPEEIEGNYKLPKDFAFGQFKITKIAAFNLKNTELVGLQDPYITLKLGEWTAKTYTQDDVGSDAVWNFLTISCDVLRDAVQSQMLEVVAFDENKGRAHALIGTGSVSLMKGAAYLGNEVELKVKLVDAGGAPSGKVVLYGTLVVPEPEVPLPDTFQEGSLKIKRVSAFGLNNAQMLGLSKGDPFIRLIVRDFKEDTKVLYRAGENPVWNHLDFAATCDAKTVKVGELMVQAWEKNSMFGDKMLCSAEIPLRPAGSKLGQEVELVAKLKTDKGEDRGEVNVLVQLDPIAALSKPDLGLPADFVAGIIRISKIQALGLQNKEMFGGKQDPYICVTVGDWNETTTTLNSAGSNATWTELDMVAEVNADMLADEKLTVRVMDENVSVRDTVLGAGVVSMRKLCTRINTPVELSVSLIATNGAAVGTVLVTAVLNQCKLEDLQDALPASAVVVKHAQLVVKKISAFDLKGGDRSFFGDKQDPYVLLALENDWNAKTEVKQNAGRSAVWADITDMELPVTGDIMKYKRISVLVMDKNSLGRDSYMGKGDFSMCKLGSKSGTPVLVSHLVRLKDKDGRAAGRVVVEAELQPLPEIAAVSSVAGGANNLQTVGTLSILEVSVSKVTDTGVTGKQDLWVDLAVADWKKTTEVNKGAGTESTWLVKCTSNPMAVAQLAKGMQVQVSGHSMKGDTMLGKATLLLDKAVSQPGKWVDIVSDLSAKASGSGSVGKIRLKARFAEIGDDSDAAFPSVGDQGFDALSNRVGSIEENLKLQLQKELAAERDSILKAMKSQNDALTQSIEGLSRELAKERQAKTNLLDGLVINQVNALKLPKDVKQWRSAHVQAWISFEVELPRYAPAFQTASIDGLVLLRHINPATLENSMDITDSMHRKRIMEGVQKLVDQQIEVDAQAERDRLAKLQKKKDEEDRKRALMLEMQREADKKKKKEDKGQVKKKKKKSTTAVAPKTYFGEVREQNVIERVRIEREMRLHRTEQQKLRNKADLSSRTWKFEYTGAPQPKVETIWDSDPFSKKDGTSAYRKTMALDILGSEQFRAFDESLPRAPSFTKVRPVPKNCAPEEVLALVKGAMYDVSNWLVEMEKIEFRKRVHQESDLYDANDGKVLSLLQQHDTSWYPATEPEPELKQDSEIASASIDESEAPPQYDTVVAMDELDATAQEDPDAPDAAEGTYVAGGESGDEDDEPLPTYDQVVDEAAEEDGMLLMSDDEGGDLPRYSTVLDAANLTPPRSPPPPNSKLFSMISESGAETQQPELDRMTLIFKALIGQQNNNARWLGANEKLTRMKLYGGFESLLRLKIDWPQFDALWTQLDNKRSGDIDLKEFKAFFGDLADFKSMMGTQALTTTAKSKSIAALSRCLFELCDALRHAGFTVVEMFSGFDRNGSGGVSISEFCSMLRLVVGNNFEKRLIYQALSVLDSNGDKSISLEEVLRFVYRVWKSQLDELAEKLSRLDERMTGDSEKIRKAVEERRLIKEAIKKNFPREWRDRLEREGGHAIPGPFQALLQRMDIGDDSPKVGTKFLSGTADAERTATQQFPAGSLSLGSPMKLPAGTAQSLPVSPVQMGRSYRPSETWSAAGGGSANTASQFSATAPLAPNKPHGSTGPRTHAQLTAAGQNEIMRFKIKVPAGCAPTRAGAQLVVPPVRDLNKGTVNSSEVTDAVLKQHAPFEGYG